MKWTADEKTEHLWNKNTDGHIIAKKLRASIRFKVWDFHRNLEWQKIESKASAILEKAGFTSLKRGDGNSPYDYLAGNIVFAINVKSGNCTLYPDNLMRMKQFGTFLWYDGKEWIFLRYVQEVL